MVIKFQSETFQYLRAPSLRPPPILEIQFWFDCGVWGDWEEESELIRSRHSITAIARTEL